MPLRPLRASCRRALVARPARLALGALALLGCRTTADPVVEPEVRPTPTATDSTPTPTEPASALGIVVGPAGTTVTQVGVDFSIFLRAGGRVTLRRIIVDSGLATERDQSATFGNYIIPGAWIEADTLRFAAFAPGPGAHRITVVAADGAGQTHSVSFTRTFDLPDAPYTATPLPDLGAGAGVRWVNGNGEVAGWVGSADGPTRAAVWTGGVLRVLPVAERSPAVALRVNSAGDVLVATGTNVASDALVLRADGTTLAFPGTGATNTFACCRVASDLNDRRQALATTPMLTSTAAFDHSAMLDVTSGAISDLPGELLTNLNDGGLAVGKRTTEVKYQSTYLLVHGGARLAPPAGPPGAYCDAAGRWTTFVPVDLDDAGNVVASLCGAAALVPTGGGASVWLNRIVGPGQTHLSRQGGVVASLDTAGTVFLWRIGTSRVSRLRLADSAWRLDSLASVNAAGAIAAHGTERTTGRSAALLLRPAGP